MKNILFISYDGMTDPLGQSQVIPYLQGLTQYGYRFTILSCDKKEKYMQHSEKINAVLKLSGIQWVSIPYHKKPPVLSGLYDLWMMKKMAKKLHLIDPFDMVHTRAGTPAQVGLWMKKEFGVKFLNDLRDFFADSRVDSGSWNLKNPIFHTIYRFFKKKEEQALKMNDGIVCLTYAAEKLIRDLPEYNVKIPLQVIPCSVDLKLFNPKNIDPVLKEKFMAEKQIGKNDFIISYLGSMGGWYLTTEMMTFCKIISDTIPQAKFLFITPHHPEVVLKKALETGIRKEKIMVTHASRQEVPTLLSFSSFSIFFIKPCYSKQASSPTKHGEIMAMGIPLITNDGVGDVADIVNKYHSGIVLKELNTKTFLDTANLLMSESSFDKNNIRNSAYDYYNLENAVSKYDEIYQKILTPRKSTQ